MKWRRAKGDKIIGWLEDGLPMDESDMANHDS